MTTGTRLARFSSHAVSTIGETATMPSTKPSASVSIAPYSGPAGAATTSWYGVPARTLRAPSTTWTMNLAPMWGISRPSR